MIDALNVRRVLGRREWSAPVVMEQAGDAVTAWGFRSTSGDGSIYVSLGYFDGLTMLHASMTRADRVPSYEDLCLLHRAVWGEGYAYQVFAPAAQHINIHPYALHLWGRVDGKPILPDFGWSGSI